MSKKTVRVENEHPGVKMADGTEFDTHAGEILAIPPGHDGWVVGEEPVVAVDWTGASDYAKG